jgi:inner membrane protein
LEPFTHAFTSLAFARAARPRLPRFGTIMLVASGLAPDLDYASYLGGADSFLRFHRTVLHSVSGVALLSCALAGAFCVLDRKISPKKSSAAVSTVPLKFRAALLVCLVGAAGHLILDLASGIGVQLLWPFHSHWSAWNLVTDFSPWMLLFLVAGLLLPLLFQLVNEEVGERRRKPGLGRAAIVTLVVLGAYLAVCAHLHGQAVDLLLSREYHGRGPLSAGAFPVTSTPFDWRGVVVTDDTLEEVDVPVGPGTEFDPDSSLTRYKPPESPALDVGEKTSLTARYLTYARFPLASVERVEDDYRFEVHDLQFAPDDTGPSNIFVRIDLTSGLQIRHQGLHFASSPNP